MTGLSKSPTGVRGFDEITLGGLPKARTTLVCGAAGSGKTLLGIEFLVRGALEFGEPGVCISFEETAAELAANVASLGFDVENLIARNLIAIDHVFLDRSMIEEAGEYDLEGLFVRIGLAVERTGAKRILLDTLEALFAGIPNEEILRSELRRLFRWLKDRSLTAVVTGERGSTTLTRHGLEEYISDCVIVLDHRVSEGVSTRRMRVVKYRGTTHGTNEYPFLIERDGISVLPITSLDLRHAISDECLSTGVLKLDEMLGGSGYFRGSTILVSGTAGTGKTSLAAHFVDAACSRGERCVYFSFEEPAEQVVRNMRSIGIDLERWMDRGLLTLEAVRPTSLGLEAHLLRMHKLVGDGDARLVVIDPVTAFDTTGAAFEAQNMLLRLMDHLKCSGKTILLTALTRGGAALEETSLNVSSLVDCWLLLRDIESGGERNRGLYVLKARGLAHSNQIREFLITPTGVNLRPVYLGEAGLITGSARVAREAEEASRTLTAQQELERKRLAIEGKRKTIEAQIAMLQVELATETGELEQLVAHKQTLLEKAKLDGTAMLRSRQQSDAKEVSA